MRNPTERVPFWRSIQVKFALTYILIVAAVLSLLNTYPLLVSRDLVITSKETSLQSQAGFIAGALAVSETLTEEGVEQAMEDLGPMTFNRIMITGPTGLVLYDTEEVGNARGHYALLWEITTALRDTGNDVFRCEYRDGAFRSWAVAPVVYRNMVIGAVYLHERDTEQASLLLGIQNNLRNISFMICAVALVMSVIVSGAITRRIAALLRAIRIVREGEYGHRVVIKGGDELSQLAGEFNELTGRLQTTEEVRRRFVSDASHELKTPLASIRLLTDSILQTGDMDPATVKDFVSDIGEEAERLTRISEKLLTLTRMDSAVAVAEVPVDVKRVVEKVEHMLTPLADEGEVTVETDLQEDCMVLATEDDLYQIAFNLMENAVKYNLPGGSVTVTLRGAGDLVTLTVEDTGVGIPEEDLGKVFDRFYRVDKARSRESGGTGLGLSIAKEIVDRHQGSIALVDRPGPGLTLRIELPVEGPGHEQ